MYQLRFLLFFILSPLLFFLFFSAPVSAQGSAFNAYTLFIDNEFPTPGETIKVSIYSNSAPTSGIRSVTWFINGEEQSQFSNALDLSSVAGHTPFLVTARIIFFDISGKRGFAEVSRWVQPVIFDIFWEGDVVTTPRYMGQKYPGPNTPILLSAKIQFVDRDGVVHTEKDFSFRWEIESRFYGGRGAGIAALVYEDGGSLLNREVTVRAHASLISSSSISFSRKTTVPITFPRLLVYPHTLLHGLHTDLTIPTTFSLPDTPTTFSVYPFFFARSAFQKDTIHYSWFAGLDSQPLYEERRVAIRVEGNDAFVPLRIIAENEHEVSQNVQNSFSIRL